MSYTKDIADALAAGLGAYTYLSVDVQPTVERRTWINISAENMADPVVFVTAGEILQTRIARGSTQADYKVNVYVGRNVNTEEAADDMYDLLDEVLLQIRAHDWGETEPAFPESVTSPMEITVDINPDDAMSDRNVWRAVVTATYRVFLSDALPE